MVEEERCQHMVPLRLEMGCYSSGLETPSDPVLTQWVAGGVSSPDE